MNNREGKRDEDVRKDVYEKRIENDLRNLLDCPSIEREEFGDKVGHDLILYLAVIVSKVSGLEEKDVVREQMILARQRSGKSVEIFKAIVVGYAVSLGTAGVS